MPPPGARREQPQARGADRPLEEAGHRETRGPGDAEEEPPPPPPPRQDSDPALLDLVLATGDDLVRGLWVLDHLGDRNHRLLEFTIQDRVSRACSKAAALDFRRADFNELDTSARPFARLQAVRGRARLWKRKTSAGDRLKRADRHETERGESVRPRTARQRRQSPSPNNTAIARQEPGAWGTWQGYERWDETYRFWVSFCVSPCSTGLSAQHLLLTNLAGH
ncbi:uncharacterized protein LOC132250969 [Alligator mississippiensis]|uniref:uncharacterized protein LOC132250969 n=1 Tax=Alligator mississippiensis TaxID=8496 RepID=UPI002877B5F8|nr:uncharacterized protein LOC132250969 [Alligator mississippiensis]